MEKQPKILIVEDVAELLRATQHVLKNAGYETIGSQDGQEALSLVKVHKPDLVLLDVNLGEINGFEVCRRIKEDVALSGVFVIILSGSHTDSNSQVKGLESGADGYIVRPISNHELVARVKAMLRIRKAEHALRFSVEQWRATFDAVNDVIFLTDTDFNILKCNLAATELWQRSSDELIGQKCYQVMHGLEASAAACPWELVCQTKRRQVVTFAKNGSWFEARIDPMFDDTGNVVGTVNIIENITERKQTEEALCESEEKFKYIFDHSVSGKSITLPSGEINVNDALCEILAYSKDELQGCTWQSITHPDDVELTQREIQSLLSGEKESARFTKRFLHKNGSVVWADMSSALRRDQDGTPLYFVTTINDITARKQAEDAVALSEKRFRALIVNSLDAITLVDANGRVVYDSPAAPGMLGYGPEDWIGKNVIELIHADDVSEIKRQLDEIVKNPSGHINLTFRLLHKSGRWLWIDAVATNLLAEPSVEAIVVNYRDITNRKQAEENLRRRTREAETLRHAASSITSSLDLNQVLDSLLGQLAQVVEYDCATLFLLEDDHLLAVTGRGLPYPEKVIGQEFPVANDLFQLMLKTGIPLIIGDVHHDSRFQQWGGTDHTHGWMGIPLIVRGESIGCITIDSCKVNAYDDAHAEMAMAFANQVAIAIQNARLYERAQHEIAVRKQAEQDRLRMFEREREQRILAETLYKVGEALTSSLNLDAVLECILVQLGHLIAFDTANIMRPTVDGARAHVVRWQGYESFGGQARLETIDWTLRETPILSQLFETGDALVLPNPQADPRWVSYPGTEWIRSYAGIPIRVGDETLGVINLDSTIPGLFDETWVAAHLPLLHAFANQAAIALKNARLYEQAQREITERKQAEEQLAAYTGKLEEMVELRTCELRETQEELVRQEKLAVLGQLAGGVGHELRNPLGVINNAVYFLKLIRPDGDEKMKEYLGIIETETRTADKIISDLLDFSRIKSVDSEPVYVSSLIERTLERFPAPTNVQVTLKVPETLPRLYVDPRQVVQVLGNLVVNAYQAMPEGGKLTIGGQLSMLGKEKFVAIAVQDSGVGITPENMKKLFEPLFTTKPKGIGLGLAVSQKLTEANGGRIEVQSETGKGSVFTVFLPIENREK